MSSGRDRSSTPIVGMTPIIGAAPGDAARSKISDYERGTNFAKQLWGEPLASLMTERLGDVRTLEKSAPEIVLASTLPLDSVHSAMFKMLKKRAATEGPQPLETAGLGDRVLSDPSLLVLIEDVAAIKINKRHRSSGSNAIRPIFTCAPPPALIRPASRAYPARPRPRRKRNRSSRNG